MYQIVAKQALNPTVTKMEILAPFVAKKALPGQFIILRVTDDGERIPLTIADYDRERGTVTIIFQIVGGTTELLNHKNAGDFLSKPNAVVFGRWLFSLANTIWFLVGAFAAVAGYLLVKRASLM